MKVGEFYDSHRSLLASLERIKKLEERIRGIRALAANKSTVRNSKNGPEAKISNNQSLTTDVTE